MLDSNHLPVDRSKMAAPVVDATGVQRELLQQYLIPAHLLNQSDYDQPSPQTIRNQARDQSHLDQLLMPLTLTNSATEVVPRDTDASTFWPIDAATVRRAASELRENFTGSWMPSLSSGSGWSYDFNSAWRTLENKTPEEVAAIDQEIRSTFGRQLARPGESFGLRELVARSVSREELHRFDDLMRDKNNNDVPPEFRTTGDQLIKPGSNIRPGEVSRVEIGDRHYQVYVPKNADSRAPVVIAMHGAAGGEGENLALNEMGMISAAERTGSIVVFAEPKVRSFDAGRIANLLGANQGVAWNVPGYLNLPRERDNSYSDVDYLNSVITNLRENVTTAERVGLAGFSDGARMAQLFASLHPDRVSGVYSGHGTWMRGDPLPNASVPIKIVLGNADQTLPITGGMGRVSSWMDWVVQTNLARSQPLDQAMVWSRTNSCTSSRDTIRPDVTITDYQCENAPVVVNVFRGGAHAWHDRGNLGNQTVQRLMGRADRTRAMGLDAHQFLIANSRLQRRLSDR
ncbi:hypothetical protein BH11CYA1_BH11CYA1_07220 [soil metagenome]